MNIERFAVRISTEATIARLSGAATAVPMGLVAHINGQANCAKKDIAVAADQILEIFRPDFAVKVWAVEKQAGIDIPIRIHVYEADGRTWVACRQPSVVFKPYANPRLDAIGVELDTIFQRILASLADVKETS